MGPLSSRSYFAAAALTLLSIHASGCSTWHSVGTEHPALFIAREKPPTVRVTLPESTLILSLPSVRGDSVLGISRGVSPPQMLAVPSSDIRKLETQGPPRTAKIMLGTLGAAAVAVAILGVISSFISRPIP